MRGLYYHTLVLVLHSYTKWLYGGLQLSFKHICTLETLYYLDYCFLKHHTLFENIIEAPLFWLNINYYFFSTGIVHMDFFWYIYSLLHFSCSFLFIVIYTGCLMSLFIHWRIHFLTFIYYQFWEIYLEKCLMTEMVFRQSYILDFHYFSRYSSFSSLVLMFGVFFKE